MAKQSSSKSVGGQTTQIIGRLQDNIRTLQGDAERLLKRTQKQAVQLISRDQRRAVDRLIKQAQRLRSDFEKRAQRASKDVESRTNRLLSTIEKEATRRFSPLMKRFDIPSRQEFQALSRRIAQLERQLKTAATSRSSQSNSEGE